MTIDDGTAAASTATKPPRPNGAKPASAPGPFVSAELDANSRKAKAVRRQQEYHAAKSETETRARILIVSDYFL
jgi:hypothetical protein